MPALFFPVPALFFPSQSIRVNELGLEPTLRLGYNDTLFISLSWWSSFIMTIERTLSIVKPDAVSKNQIGEIIHRFERAGLKVVAAKMLRLSKERAEAFYDIHKNRPFFNDLVNFMLTGPVLVQVLEGDNAIAKNREIMGATNPKDAAPGTIRADLAESIEANAVHGSDSPENAKVEINFFFTPAEIYSRA